ncbi:IPT/TIG domain-containing protein [bacterium]|nr:IPT/TIG domain-containing protein [bacterium]
MKIVNIMLCVFTLILFIVAGCDKSPSGPEGGKAPVEPTITELNDFASDDVRALAMDSAGNLYAWAGETVFQLSPNGEKTSYGRAAWAYHSWFDMKMGPGGYLYVSQSYLNWIDLGRIPPGGGDGAGFIRFQDQIYSMDFDSRGNLYIPSSSGLMVYNPGSGLQETGRFTDYSVTCVRIYNGYVYIAGSYRGMSVDAPTSGIWRSEILSDTGDLSEEELVFYWDQAGDFARSNFISLTFSEKGDMFIGTNHKDPVLVVPRKGDRYPNDDIYALGEGLWPAVEDTTVSPPLHKIMWGNGETLYVLRSRSHTINQRLFKVKFGMRGAPYYGRSLPDLEPEYNEPVITEVSPQVCTGGANYITITGEHFSSAIEELEVYFDEYPAEIIEASDTHIQVRRPALNFGILSSPVTIVVKVIKNARVLTATYAPYQVDTVVEIYKHFYDQNPLRALAMDTDENCYVFQSMPRNVVRIAPSGDQFTVGETERPVSDAIMGPDGQLVLFMNNRRINQLDVMTGAETEWLDTGERIGCGDFDSEGNLYIGGRRTDLIVAAPDLSFQSLGFYATDDIRFIRVYDDYVYLLVETGYDDINIPELAVWRHRIQDANGTLGTRELVLDWAETGEFAESDPVCFTFSASGTMVFGTDHEDPVLMVEPDGTLDILYKGLITSFVLDMVWGNSTYLYAVTEDDLIRIDMGEPGAPYYGR